MHLGVPLCVVLMVLPLLVGCSARDKAAAPTVGPAQTPTPSPPETALASSATTKSELWIACRSTDVCAQPL